MWAKPVSEPEKPNMKISEIKRLAQTSNVFNFYAIFVYI